MKKLCLALVCAFCLTSCYTTRLMVGDVDPEEPMVKVNQRRCIPHYIFGTVRSAGSNLKVKDYMGETKNYMVKTNMSFLDGVLTTLTGGLYMPTQAKFYVPLREYEQYVKPERVRPRRTNGGFIGIEAGYRVTSYKMPEIKTVEDMLKYPDVVESEWKYKKYYYLSRRRFMYSDIVNVNFGYKWTHFLISARVGIGSLVNDRAYYDYIYYDDDTVNTDFSGSNGDVTISIGMRFRYYMLKSRVTPFLGIDVNMPFYGEFSYDDIYGTQHYTDSGISICLSPHIGISCRVGRNGFIDCGLFYEMADVFSGASFEGAFAFGDKWAYKTDYIFNNNLAVRVGYSFLF